MKSVSKSLPAVIELVAGTTLSVLLSIENEPKLFCQIPIRERCGVKEMKHTGCEQTPPSFK